MDVIGTCQLNRAAAIFVDRTPANGKREVHQLPHQHGVFGRRVGFVLQNFLSRRVRLLPNIAVHAQPDNVHQYSKRWLLNGVTEVVGW